MESNVGSQMLAQAAVIMTGAALTIATGVLVPVIKAWILKKIRESDAGLAVKEQESGIQIRWAIKELMKDAVRIARQAGFNRWIADIGAEKKKFAVAWAKEQLAKNNLPALPVEEIADMIEAAYFEIFKEPYTEVIEAPCVEGEPLAGVTGAG